MKFKHLHRRELELAAVISCSLVLFGCGDFTAKINPYYNDVVKVTTVNKFINDADEKAGLLKAQGDDIVSRVLMSHKVHENANVACKECHHKVNNDDRIKQCARCHKGIMGMDVMHTACMNCHLTKRKGPVMCQKCHEPVQQKL